MTGKPVLAASASENVLFPDPASPVTMTRRPCANWASLIAVSAPHVPLDDSARGCLTRHELRIAEAFGHEDARVDLAGEQGALEAAVDVELMAGEVRRARAVEEHHRPRLLLGDRVPAERDREVVHVLLADRLFELGHHRRV